MQIGRSPVLSQRCTHQAGKHPGLWRPSCHDGKRWEETHPSSASTTRMRDVGSDSNEVQAAGKAQSGLNSICSLWGTCSISQIQGNSHKTQVICCNIVAGSYSQLAETGDVLGVPGLPQSAAGRRYEISIYILQPDQESDNLTAKLRAKQSSLKRLVGADGAGRVPGAPGTWWPRMGSNGVPRSTQPLYPEKLRPPHLFCSLTTQRVSPSPPVDKEMKKAKREKVNSSNRASSKIWALFFSQDFNED